MIHQKKLICILSSIFLSLISIIGHGRTVNYTPNIDTKEIRCIGRTESGNIILYSGNVKIIQSFNPNDKCKRELDDLKDRCSQGWGKSHANTSTGCLYAKVIAFDDKKCTIKAKCKHGPPGHVKLKVTSNTCDWNANWHGTTRGTLECS